MNLKAFPEGAHIKASIIKLLESLRWKLSAHSTLLLLFLEKTSYFVIPSARIRRSSSSSLKIVKFGALNCLAIRRAAPADAIGVSAASKVRKFSELLMVEIGQKRRVC